MMETKIEEQLHLGDVAPNFDAVTTVGNLNFYDWLGDSWCVLFSHPKDFTPVCTTELGIAAKLKPEFDERNVKILALSVNDLESHKRWVPEINETQATKINYPLIADEAGSIARKYGMIHPKLSDTSTVRTVFVIDPNKKIRLFITYPASTGRNFFEIIRVIDSLQLTDRYKVATPANWVSGGDCMILPSVTDEEELKRLFPKGYKTIKSYLRITPDPKI